jgi:flagellar basal-body rod protein FlgG
MLRAFSTAATGMTGQQTMIDVVAHNLANVNTNGFKKSNIDFQDLLYLKQKDAGAEVESGQNSPSGIEIGSGVRVASTVKDFSMGELQNTGRSLDIAIMGEGFLQVTMADGSTKYTRDGALLTNGDGSLVTTTGYLIEPAVTIPSNAVSVDIGNDGTVNVTDSTGTASVVGNIQLARFVNPAGLSNDGDNLLSETEASGTALTGTPGQNGFGAIKSGFLEKSNVQMVTELVALITAQRAYEINSKAIQAGDDILRTTNNIVR